MPRLSWINLSKMVLKLWQRWHSLTVLSTVENINYWTGHITGRMSTSQLAKGAAFLALCELYGPIQELNYDLLLDKVVGKKMRG